MEIELSDLSALPDGLKPLAVAAGDKFKLDLSKLMPSEDLTGLKTALVRERENGSAYAKFGKPDEIAARITALEASVAKGGKGGEDAQAKLDAMKSDYEAKLTEATGRVQKMMSNSATAELKAQLAQAGVVPEGLDMLAQFAAQRIQFHEDGRVKVLSSDGKPMIGSGADHGATLGDLARELAKSMPYLVKDGGAGGGGKPPGNNGGKPGKTMKQADFNALSAKQRAALMADGLSFLD